MELEIIPHVPVPRKKPPRRAARVAWWVLFWVTLGLWWFVPYPEEKPRRGKGRPPAAS